jgi:uncharacterized repeat protein (TIGR03803 family)
VYPDAGLVRDSAGNLYGTTEGSVFKLSPTGAFTLLHNFGTGRDVRPNGLIRDSSGNLYGSTLFGGRSNRGTVFELDKKGKFSVFFRFTGGTCGSSPLGLLVLDPAGNLYGAASGGNEVCSGGGYGFGCGVVFKLDTRQRDRASHLFERAERHLPQRWIDPGRSWQFVRNDQERREFWGAWRGVQVGPCW